MDTFRHYLSLIVPLCYRARRVDWDPLKALSYQRKACGCPPLPRQSTLHPFITCIACSNGSGGDFHYSTSLDIITPSNSIQPPADPSSAAGRFLGNYFDRVNGVVTALSSDIQAGGEAARPAYELLQEYSKGNAATHQLSFDGNQNMTKFGGLNRQFRAPPPADPLPGHVYEWAIEAVFQLSFMMVSDKQVHIDKGLEVLATCLFFQSYMI